MKTETVERTIVEQIKHCSDYDDECKDVKSPGQCFLGGIWVCKNGHASDVPMADGLCKEMEVRRNGDPL